MKYRTARSILVIFLNILAASIVGLVLLLLVFVIPTKPIDRNVAASAPILEKEGTYPKLSELFRSQLDNYTDSLMLMEAADNSATGILDRALNVYNHRVGDLSPSESIAAHYLEGKEYTQTSSYARYWHGYLVILKPLLTVANYRIIRILNAIVQLILLLGVFVLLNSMGMRAYIIPYVLSYLMLRPVALSKSMQFSTCYYIFTIAVMAVLLAYKNNDLGKRALFIFLYAGIATAYLDYLTYPVVTLCIPLVAYISLTKSDSLKEKILAVVSKSLVWGCGYLGMWSLKWVIASMFTSENVIADAINTLTVRMSTKGSGDISNFTKIQGVTYNTKSFVYTPVMAMVLVYMIWLIFRIFKFYKSSKASNDGQYNNSTQSKAFLREYMTVLLPYILIAMIPVVWYIATTNHSCVHTYYTNKALVGSLMAVLWGLLNIDRQA